MRLNKALSPLAVLLQKPRPIVFGAGTLIVGIALCISMTSCSEPKSGQLGSQSKPVALKTEPGVELVLVPQIGHSGAVFSMAFSQDGSKLATGSSGTVIIWDIESGLAQWSMSGHIRWVNCLCFSPDGRKLALGGSDKPAIIWDVASGRQEKMTEADMTWFTKAPEAERVTNRCIVWRSPDGKKQASYHGDSEGNEPGPLIIRDVESAREKVALQGYAGPVGAVAFSSDGKKLASGSRNKVTIWDMEKGRADRVLELHPSESDVTSVAFDRAGKKLAVGTYNETVVVWNLESGRAEHRLNRHEEDMGDGVYVAEAIEFTPDGKKLVVDSSEMGDCCIYITWDLASEQVEEFESGGISLDDISPDGSKVAFHYYGAITIRDMETWRDEKRLDAYRACFSPDGKMLAAATEDSITIWDVASWQVRKTLHGHTGLLTWMSFSPDGRKLAAGLEEGSTIFIWDMQRGQLEKTLKGELGAVTPECWADGSMSDMVVRGFFSPDGNRLVSELRDGTLLTWDIASGRQENMFKTFAAGRSAVHGVCLSPGKDRLAWASDNETITIYDLQSGIAGDPLKGHTDAIQCVSFSPDGKKLISASEDGSIKVWDAATGLELATLYPLVGDDSWLVATPEGYYDCSPEGRRYVAWRVGDSIYPADQFEEKFHRPDLVRKALVGR